MRPFVVAAALSLGAATLVASGPADAGAPPTLEFEASPSPAYGSVAVGTSVQRTFTVRNPGGSSTAVVDVTLVGSPAFTIAPGGDQCGGRALGPRRTCTITVTYAPSSASSQDAAILTAGSRKAAGVSITLTGGAEPMCTDGEMRVAGSGFDTCDAGVWVYRDCAPGTHAVQVSPGVILCDW